MTGNKSTVSQDQSPCTPFSHSFIIPYGTGKGLPRGAYPELDTGCPLASTYAF